MGRRTYWLDGYPKRNQRMARALEKIEAKHGGAFEVRHAAEAAGYVLCLEGGGPDAAVRCLRSLAVWARWMADELEREAGLAVARPRLGEE
jgi:hypothetical protein